MAKLPNKINTTKLKFKTNFAFFNWLRGLD